MTATAPLDVPAHSWKWREFQVDVPEGQSGDWSIERFDVTAQQAMLAGIRPRWAGGCHLEPGHYTRLRHRREVIMSDTPDEIRDHLEPVRRAHGVCLIHGLGLGMVLNACARRVGVEKVVCIEIDEDVIDLAAPHYLNRWGRRVEIHHGDAFTWKPPAGVRFGMVWHDIWPTISGDNLEAMGRLHRRYGRRADWQGSWARDLCELADQRGR